MASSAGDLDGESSSLSVLTVSAQDAVSAGDAVHPARMSRAGYMVVGATLTLTWVLGTLGNATCLAVFTLHKRLRSPTNMFVMSLNTSDLLMSSVACFFCLSSAWRGGWLYGHAGCTFEGFLVYLLGMTSMYSLAAISLDRYIVIAKPLLGPRITPRVAGGSIALCWLGGFLWAALPLVGWNEYRLEGGGISCSVVWESTSTLYTSYIWAIFFFCFLLPVGVMFFSYYHIFMTIRVVSRNQTWDKNSRIARRNQKVEKKMAKTIAAMLGSGSISAELATYPAIIAKSQGVLNPIIYVASNKQFRQAFYELLPCLGLRRALVKQIEKEGESEESDVDEDTAGPTTRAERAGKNKGGKQPQSKQKASCMAVHPTPGNRHPTPDVDNQPSETVVEDIFLVSDAGSQGHVEEIELKDKGCVVTGGCDLGSAPQ
ncbi:visual pigment-like receptor peropsin isoform X2 [Pomacea canaliculata]|uniref:visual pigment-like receptor peropsin isoform X2 n=1 Tax=Pomacea canaliculata TaxID=400727 RepID=UPI000D735E12|nr:visual pigment-like receptor peropsin isoform X2 [Pomacea canaliculata]